MEFLLKKKFFYTGFQRCGTKSFKNIINQNGCTTVSWRECDKNSWGKKVIEGKFNEIINSKDFDKSDYYEDFPYHDLNFIKFLAKKFINSRFIHVERNPIEWFESMVSHSGGVTLGGEDSYVHSCYYKRLDTWQYLKDKLNRPPKRIPIITDKNHYLQFYIKENLKIKNFFKKELSTDRFIILRLDDESIYSKICKFLNFPNTSPKSFHKSNKNLDIEKINKNFIFM